MTFAGFLLSVFNSESVGLEILVSKKEMLASVDPTSAMSNW